MRHPAASWHEYLFRVLLRKYTRLLVAILPAWGVGHALASRGDPWWLWLPAVLLTSVVALWLWVFIWYTYQKATLPRRVAEHKRRLRDKRETAPPREA